MKINKYKDVVGIGNAIVDIVAHGNKKFLSNHSMAIDGMVLVSSEKMKQLCEAVGPYTQMPGGSVANTMAGIASLGGTGTYIGKVRNDEIGIDFCNKLESMGINVPSIPAKQGLPTARSIVIITPDEHRSMATYLGACSQMTPEDINESIISNHSITYLEGYLWDVPHAKEAMLKAAKYSKSNGHKVALTLSDSMCVERHRESFLKLIKGQVDILFGNEEEIMSLYQVKTIHSAIEHVIPDCEFAAITSGAAGSIIVSGTNIHPVNSIIPDRVVDVTGAGDLYAAGVLFGITHGYKLEQIGLIGSIVASEAISHVGARPQTDLRELIKGAHIP